MGKRYDVEERSTMLKQYRESGLSKSGWCKQNGVSAPTLNRWLEAEFRSESAPVQEWVALSPPVIGRGEISIEAGGFRITISGDIAPERLQSVLQAVKATC